MGADIAKILGATTRRDGYFEGAGYCVTWTFGHLCTLKEPADYNATWKHWSLGQLPMIPPRFGIKLKEGDRGIAHQFSIIERLIGESEKIINCGDAGQEGELIQRWVMQKAGCSKPVERLWINSLTDDAIREGFKNLRPAADLDALYTAGLCRAIGDWMLGMNATRLYTLKYRKNSGAVLSIGRVQTPTLALIVNRQKDIENFKPTDSWELRTIYRDTLFTAVLDAFATEDKGQQVLDNISGAPFTIVGMQKKGGSEAPPRLFDLTSLQVECNKKFSMTADETLKTIQSLYEKKVTSYPRVDTTYLTDDVYPRCGTILNSLSQYASLLAPLRGTRLKKSKKVFDNSKVTDHHAIIPTGIDPATAGLDERERKVMNLIALRFISAFYPDCKFETTQVTGKVVPEASKAVNFKATGKVIVDPGWKTVYGKGQQDENNADSDATQTMPQFTPGESGPHKPLLAKKTTQPPKYYTEGTLLKAMETAGNSVEDEDLRDALKANGIGRPSTRAAIIETLFKRGYIRRDKKNIKATQAGMDLISLIKEDLLKSAELTGIWERRLRMIERGQYDAASFIAQLKEMIGAITLSVLSDNSNRRIETVVESSVKVPASRKDKKKARNE